LSTRLLQLALLSVLLAPACWGDEARPVAGQDDVRAGDATSPSEAAAVAAREASQANGDGTTDGAERGLDPAGETDGPGVGSDSSANPGPGSTLGSRDPSPDPEIPGSDSARPSFERPDHVRGIYLNAWAAGSSRRRAKFFNDTATTEIYTFVIDLKDASGFVSHRTSVPMAKEAGATGEIRIRDLTGVLTELRFAGVYPIARIVVFKDPLLARARKDLAVQDTAGGVWVDGKGQIWLNPVQRAIWDYNVALAREAAEFGFPEIQWDYVRFPDAPESEMARAVFPGSEGATRSEAIREFLEYAKARLADLDVTVTADVFGISTLATRDVGIGQLWECFIDLVDVALPMVYPSHYYPGNYGFTRPNAYPYEVVLGSLRDAIARSGNVAGAGSVRPWLQDFTLGRPRYGPAEVRAQIQATYDAGIQEWILWNSSSRYTEEALKPVGGFLPWTDPWIRVGGQVIPAWRRPPLAESLDSAEATATGAQAESPGFHGKILSCPAVHQDASGEAGSRNRGG
jgi:hypothetical protein